MIRILDARGRDKNWAVSNLKRRSQLDFKKERDAVLDILSDIKSRGDEAVLEYTKRFDRADFEKSEYMAVSQQEIDNAYKNADESYINILKKSREKIKKFHEKQKQNSWVTYEEDGVILGQRVIPLERVGIYVPGGRAAYPSSVLMAAVPARVAGVDEVIMVTPPNFDGLINPNTLVAAKVAGIDKIYKVGGAQGVAALAFGTETIPKVDKIVGPGNIYVTLAKKEVYGHVDIDMIAGPSEVLVVADKSANPEYIAADLMSQAEHDPMASSILVTDSMELAKNVSEEIKKQVASLSTKETIKESLGKYGALIVFESIDRAIDMANYVAPEHLELAVDNPFELMGDIKHAGAVFLGHYSPEPLGDYMAGPNHVLPTSGTARFFSPLGVDDFTKKSSVISYSKKALSNLQKDIADFARAEGLTAHANSIEVRFK